MIGEKYKFRWRFKCKSFRLGSGRKIPLTACATALFLRERLRRVVPISGPIGFHLQNSIAHHARQPHVVCMIWIGLAFSGITTVCPCTCSTLLQDHKIRMTVHRRPFEFHPTHQRFEGSLSLIPICLESSRTTKYRV